jgi:hypothetical protein
VHAPDGKINKLRRDALEVHAFDQMQLRPSLLRLEHKAEESSTLATHSRQSLKV